MYVIQSLLVMIIIHYRVIINYYNPDKLHSRIVITHTCSSYYPHLLSLLQDVAGDLRCTAHHQSVILPNDLHQLLLWHRLLEVDNVTPLLKYLDAALT